MTKCLRNFLFILQIVYSGKSHVVEIVDTAGQEEFTSFLESSLSTGDAFMVLYAINSLSSWNDLKSLRSKIFQEIEGLSNSSCRIPMIIVGNKKVSKILLKVQLPLECVV